MLQSSKRKDISINEQQKLATKGFTPGIRTTVLQWECRKIKMYGVGHRQQIYSVRTKYDVTSRGTRAYATASLIP